MQFEDVVACICLSAQIPCTLSNSCFRFEDKDVIALFTVVGVSDEIAPRFRKVDLEVFRFSRKVDPQIGMGEKVPSSLDCKASLECFELCV